MTERVNFEAVRDAVGDQDPHSTNASKIRNQLGRGSQSTIQNHLDVLRANWLKRHQAVSQEGMPIPPAPTEMLQGLWAAAFDAARARVMEQLAALSERAAAAQVTLTAQAEDKLTLGAEIERLETELEQAHVEAGDITRGAAAKVAEMEVVVTTLREQIVTLEAERTQRDAEHRVALNETQLEIKTLQGVVDRSGERAGELRAELEHERRRNQELVEKLEALARRPSSS